ncbi:MAG: DUF1549 domain-containing protein [Planctomycetia bacterium]|nr:DUF1549 domain-containing protein [Planctomycetia bacterium]
MSRPASAFVASAMASLALTAAAAEGRLDFNRDVRPILSDRCFACHGPDGEDRQAGLRLDLRDAAIAALDSGGTAIVPGDPAKSEILARITSTDPDVVMPPPRVNKPITPAEAKILERWIAEGAEYRGHWAFERVERPDVPDAKDASWARTPIDRFILARLEQEGLAPNPEADRVTLARRLALDLTGLPPVPAEVDAFVADTAPDAFERYVDTLLASPHYGERMAIEWLDAARYADSHGYQTDSSRSNWPWRDWVIEAYNANLPFDRFTIHQLAGDMLETPTREQIVATGFNRNHRINGEGGIIAEEWRVETVIDRVETTSQTWMALSAGCARCHDHKYDPLSQREFYALFSLFNNVPESGTIMGSQNRSGGNSDPLQLIPSPEQERELARLEQFVADAEAALKAEHANIDALVAEWEASIRPALAAPQDAWEPFEPLELRSVGDASFRRSEDGSWFVEGRQLVRRGHVAGPRHLRIRDPRARRPARWHPARSAARPGAGGWRRLRPCGQRQHRGHEDRGRDRAAGRREGDPRRTREGGGDLRTVGMAGGQRAPAQGGEGQGLGDRRPRSREARATADRGVSRQARGAAGERPTGRADPAGSVRWPHDRPVSARLLAGRSRHARRGRLEGARGRQGGDRGRCGEADPAAEGRAHEVLPSECRWPDPAGRDGPRRRDEERRVVSWFAPERHGDEGGARAGGVRPHPGRVRQAGREGHGGAAGIPARAARGHQARPARAREMARLPGPSAHVPRVGEPHVGAVVRRRPLEDERKPRQPGGIPEPPRAARLARRGVHGDRLGHEAVREARRDERRVSTVRHGHAREAGPGSGEQAARAGPQDPAPG